MTEFYLIATTFSIMFTVVLSLWIVLTPVPITGTEEDEFDDFTEDQLWEADGCWDTLTLVRQLLPSLQTESGNADTDCDEQNTGVRRELFPDSDPDDQGSSLGCVSVSTGGVLSQPTISTQPSSALSSDTFGGLRFPEALENELEWDMDIQPIEEHQDETDQRQ